VLELLEGETLADLIKRGPLPAREAARLGAEIAEALDAAHGQGLIHRDLKPGNVMLTRTGIKLLDFGLARALDATADELSRAATATIPVTAAGTILGTLPYMAPEQVEGKPVDARADLFALGAILYEMITGKRAFHGESQGSLIASLLKEEPPPLPEPAASSPGIERCMRRCLEKDRDRRWQSARDLMYELLWLAEEREEPFTPERKHDPRSRWWSLVAVAAIGLMAGMAAGRMMVRGTKSPGDDRPILLSQILPEGTRLNGWASPVVALSSDGRALAFVADAEDGIARLYVRRLDSPDPVLVPNSETAEGPFFSPDYRWVGFAVGVSSASGRGGELLKYSLETGLTQSICPLEDYFGADWGHDGEILFVNGSRGGLWKVPAAGGAPRNILPAVRMDGKEVRRTLVLPLLLPDGRHAVVTDVNPGGSRLAVVDLESGELAPLGISAERAFLAGDHLLYADKEGSLFGVPFDQIRRVTDGAPVALMDGIARTRFDIPVLDISANGTLVQAKGFVRGSRIMPSELVHIDGTGAATVLPFPQQMIERSVDVSPSGDRLAAALRDGTIWIQDLDRGTRAMLPAGAPSSILQLSWSPDGRQIGFCVWTGERFALMRQLADGHSGPEVVLSEETAELESFGWTPDGEGMLYRRWIDESASIRVLRLSNPDNPEILVDGLHASFAGKLSPDGRWLAYDSPDSGEYEVYVQSLSGASDRFVVSSGGGRNPRWSPDGRTLFYYEKGRIMSVGAPQAPGGKFGRPRTVAETDIDPAFSVDPRGGFYGFRPVPGVGIQKSLNLILNWNPSNGSPAR